MGRRQRRGAAELPVRQDGFPFFDAPLAADVSGDGTRQVMEGNDSFGSTPGM